MDGKKEENMEVVQEDCCNSESENHIVEGKHMQHFRQCRDLSLQKFCSSFKLSLFKRHLRPLYKSHSKDIKGMHHQFMEQLKSNVTADMEALLEEENLIEKMNKLDEVIEKNPNKGSRAWRPSGNAALDVQAHILPHKIKGKEQLESILSTMESQNKLLKEAVRPRMVKLMQTKQKIHQLTEEWREVGHVLDSVDENVYKTFLLTHPSSADPSVVMKES